MRGRGQSNISKRPLDILARYTAGSFAASLNSSLREHRPLSDESLELHTALKSYAAPLGPCRVYRVSILPRIWIEQGVWQDPAWVSTTREQNIAMDYFLTHATETLYHENNPDLIGAILAIDIDQPVLGIELNKHLRLTQEEHEVILNPDLTYQVTDTRHSYTSWRGNDMVSLQVAAIQ